MAVGPAVPVEKVGTFVVHGGKIMVDVSGSVSSVAVPGVVRESDRPGGRGCAGPVTG